jgi:hypothetical protein
VYIVVHSIASCRPCTVAILSTVQTLAIILTTHTNYFKKVYQLITNFVKDENGDVIADPHNILHW